MPELMFIVSNNYMFFCFAIYLDVFLMIALFEKEVVNVVNRSIFLSFISFSVIPIKIISFYALQKDYVTSIGKL